MSITRVGRFANLRTFNVKQCAAVSGLVTEQPYGR
jgi:hypothetical protein